jgi:Rab GDP dissociation inhibitor
MGLWEKKRCRDFFIFTENYDEKDPKKAQGFNSHSQTALDLFKKFSLDPNTMDFLGHATALYYNDDYLAKPAYQMIERIRLYSDSMGRYGDSPFLYPIYGLGGIPEGFSRLAAIHGGTYMLRTNADEILFENGKVAGIRSGTDKAYAPLIICDPSYVLNIPNKVKKTGQVIRAICLLKHTIPNTKDAHSCQIIIPQKQVNRKSDIYIALVSSTHAVCPKDYYIAMVSTNVETKNPEAEIQPALKLLGPVVEMFVSVKDIFEPTTDGKDDGLFISKGDDATSHYESSIDDVLEMYKRITNETLDLTNLPPDEEDQPQPPPEAVPTAMDGVPPPAKTPAQTTVSPPAKKA